MKTIRRTVFLIVVTCGLGNAADLNAVLEKAQNYVAVYEDELGALIGHEEYFQKAEWQSGLLGSRSRRQEQRRLNSDFVLVRVGAAWFGARNVLRVDGRGIKTQKENLTGVFADPPKNIANWLNRIQAENARYNIGDFQRTVNVPTFPLSVLRKANVGRFSFEKRAETQIDGKLDTGPAPHF